jgi:hypothetical protein
MHVWAEQVCFKNEKLEFQFLQIFFLCESIKNKILPESRRGPSVEKEWEGRTRPFSHFLTPGTFLPWRNQGEGDQSSYL